jgi:uncharacterized membrane protein YhaH (DUF805 family)
MRKQLLWLYFSFRGRLRRAAFWWSLVSASVAFAALFAALDATLGYASTLLVYPPYFWALAALGTKRLHDRGKSPLWFLALLVPVLGALWALVELGLRRGSAGENLYGDDPLEVRADYLTVS